MSTDKSAAAARELVERWMGKKHPITMRSYVSDLTALIEEHYYPKEKYDDLLQQRDELKEALILAEGLIDMASDKEWAKIRAAIKNTKDETDTIQR